MKVDQLKIVFRMLGDVLSPRAGHCAIDHNMLVKHNGITHDYDNLKPLSASYPAIEGNLFGRFERRVTCSQ